MTDLRRFVKQITYPRDSVVMVHIGKCGGSTLQKVLTETEEGRALRFVHTQKPPIRSDLSYHIVARGPVSRALSAFNWRYRLVVADERQTSRFPGEYEILERYGTLNRLAADLYTAEGRDNPQAQKDFRQIHHLREDIAFYLDDLLAAVSPLQIRSVLMQESLNADLERVFGIRNEVAQKSNKTRTDPEKLQLDPQARANLMRFLHRDFACLQTLYCWGKLSREALVAAL